METKIIIYIIILILIIRLLYILKKKYDNHKKNRIYLQINGSPENDNKILKEYEKTLDKEFTSLDYYRLGSLYDYVQNDVNKASHFYKLGLQQIKENKSDENNNYVISKIQDRIHLNNLYKHYNVEEMPLNDNHINEIKQNINEIKQNTNKIKQNTNKIKQNTTIQTINQQDLVKWTSDSQNVHDTNINQEIISQFNELKIQIPVSEWTPIQIAKYIQDNSCIFPEFESKRIPNVIKMLNYINKYNPTIAILDISESIFIGLIFTYIMRQDNKGQQQIMLENFINNLYDMNPNDETPVCINGRITRALSTLALPESNSNLGILKSKQVIQNEIFSRVGELQKKILDNTPENIVNDYNLDKSTQDVINLKQYIISSIDNNILSDYKDINLKIIRNQIVENI